MTSFSKLSRSLFRAKAAPARGKEGARAYAVGDIHGRLDLLDAMLDMIERDAAARPAKKTYVVFLGDLIDRGPDSAGVIARLRGYRPDFATPIFIAGNHEEVLLRIAGGEHDILKDWLTFGGAEFVESYGLSAGTLRKLDRKTAAERLLATIPHEDLDFLDGFADSFRFGDYLFVHAGIRPGIAIGDQDQFDLRWIREPFLSEREHHGVMIVHGHTIAERVDERSNRIGIDTGAYRTGVLTAVGIEDEDRWYLSTPQRAELQDTTRYGSGR